VAQVLRAATEESRERKIALFWTLVHAKTTGQPITQDEIVARLMIDDLSSTGKIPRRKRAYDGNDNATRQKFERDKAAIRDLGFDITTVKTLDGVDAYEIDPASVFAPPLGLTDDERALVSWAVSLLGIGTSGVARLFVDGPATGGVVFSPTLLPLTRAIATQRVVRFQYRKDNDKVRLREIAALGITLWRGAPYVVGVELATETMKGFRVSRIESTPVVTRDVFDVTDALREQARTWEPRSVHERDGVEARFLTSREFATVLSADFDAEIAPRDDTTVEVRISFVDSSAARRALLSFGPNVRELRPKSLRDDVVTWLKGVGTRKAPNGSSDFAELAPARADILTQTLQLIAAVYEEPTAVRASVLAAKCDLDLALVRSIMSRLMALQYLRDTTDYLVHIEPGDDLDDDEPVDPLYVRSASYDDGQQLSPLTWRDTFELLVALKEASRVYPGRVLEGLVAKIENVVHANVRVADVEPAFLSKIRDAIDHHEQVKIDYWSAARDEVTTRWVEPRAMASRNGRWYFRAWCATREQWLTFRVDRIVVIHAASPVTNERSADPVIDWADQPGEEGYDVTVSLDPSLRWLFEPLPTSQWAPFTGTDEVVRFRVRDDRFLEQLMVEAGPAAAVLSAGREKAGRSLARRMIELL